VWGLRLVFATSLLVAFATLVGWREIGRALGEVDRRLLALSWLIGLTARGGEALQLSWIMRRAKLAVYPAQVFLASSLSTLYGLFLPGDLVASTVKWAYLSNVTQQRSRVLNAIVYNRVVTLIAWLLGGSLAIAADNPWRDGRMVSVAIAALAALGSGAVVLYHPRTGVAVDRLLGAASARLLPGSIDQRVGYLIASLAPMRQFPWSLHASVLAMSCFNAGLLFLAFATMAVAVGIEVPWLVLVWVWMLVLLVRQLPISFQGVGVREVTLVVLLGRCGVPQAAAFSLGLLGLTHVLLFATLGLAFQTLLLAHVPVQGLRNY
jgi:uncharacterized membrane protein YbhN (UPF0104 family)